MTPLIQQYFAIKKKYPDAILLFRVGDFYETFNEDAEIVARHMHLKLVLTEKKDDVKASASLPHYWLDAALHKLVKAGHKVAVCEQLETEGRPDKTRRYRLAPTGKTAPSRPA